MMKSDIQHHSIVQDVIDLSHTSMMQYLGHIHAKANQTGVEPRVAQTIDLDVCVRNVWELGNSGS